MDDKILENLKRVADAIVAVVGSNAEVVIHDLSNIDHSVVYIAGDLTGREIGAPISHFPFRIFKEQGDSVNDVMGYRNVTKSGRVMKCSTVFIRNEMGKVVGCYSINVDVSEYIRLATLFSEQAEFTGQAESVRKELHTTTFPETVETIVENAVTQIGKPPSDMTKDDRKKIVANLEQAGAFMYKGAVQRVAEMLGTSRFTIYGYLREFKAD